MTKAKTEAPDRERWRLFVEAYMGEHVGDQGAAARAAGFGTPSSSSKSLSEIGRKLLRNPEVVRMLEERRAACPKTATREELQARWSARGRGEPVVVKLKGKRPQFIVPTIKEMLRADELLGKSLGLFIEKREVDVRGGVQIVAVLPPNGRDDGT